MSLTEIQNQNIEKRRKRQLSNGDRWRAAKFLINASANACLSNDDEAKKAIITLSDLLIQTEGV